MIESSPLRNGRRRARLLVEGLRRRRWLLAVSVAALFAMQVASPAPLWIFGGALAAVVAAALLSPGPGTRDRAVPATVVTSRRGDLTVHSLVAAISEPVIVFDRRAIVVLANRAAQSAFGSLSVGISLPLRFRTPEFQALLDQITAGKVTTASIDHIERGDMERVYRVTTTAIGGESGLFVVLFKDNSETRRIDRMRSDFIANASHELRTPLASVSGFLETLRGPARNDPEARDRFLQIMQGQTARMARLIDDLLSLSRLEMKPTLVEGAEVDLSALLDGVVSSLKPLAADNGVVIENNLSGRRLAARGDRDELIQIFVNLLENACKYGRSGGRVTVSADEPAAPGEVAVTVRDFGPGIADEHIPRVTERFYRVDVETSRSQKGTGLGLAIVKHILTRHRGRLTIASKLGEGSAFTVHLPSA
jgi:two-component system phosphate regulon sensor histidine kinase PhoR